MFLSFLPSHPRPEFTHCARDWAERDQWFAHYTLQQNDLQGLFKHRGLSSIPRVPESAGRGWRLRISISNKFPGDATDLG